MFPSDPVSHFLPAWKKKPEPKFLVMIVTMVVAVVVVVLSWISIPWEGNPLPFAKLWLGKDSSLCCQPGVIVCVRVVVSVRVSVRVTVNVSAGVGVGRGRGRGRWRGRWRGRG